jgi:hypothetical protein
MENLPEPEKRRRVRRPPYSRLDSFVRLFLGPADRGGSENPVVHRHDAAEDLSETQLAGIEMKEDSEGHHYAVRRPTEET